jgi:hypothetical protein
LGGSLPQRAQAHAIDLVLWFMRDALGSMLSSGSTDQRAYLARAKRVRRAQNCAKKRCKTRDFASKNSKQRSVAVFEEFGQKKRVVLMFFTLIAACFEILVR